MSNPIPKHPAVRPRCPLCAGRSYLVRPQGEHAKAELCTCVGPCPICRDSGYTVQRDPQGRRSRTACVCRVVKARLGLFDALRLPGRMAHTERSTFQPVGKEALQLIGASSRWVDDFDPQGRDQGLILYGDVGRGKTHIMVGLLRELVFEYGVHARFIEFSHLLQELKHGFDKGEGASQRIEPLIAVDVLGIDELGKGRVTEFEMAVVDELVTRRYNAGRTILATTNYAPGPAMGRRSANLADAAKTQPRLIDRVGERVYSRLRETCSFVPVGGDDFRERIHVG